MLRMQLRNALFSIPLLIAAGSVPAQVGTSSSSQAAPANTRILGTVTAIGAGSLTVHQESVGDIAGDVSVAITPQTRLLRTAPGEKTLKNATPMQVGDLAVGDRVLIRPTSEGDPAHPTAGILIAMKQGDIAQAHEQDSADWQRRGVAGIVASVQPIDTGGSITLRPQAGAPPVVIHTTSATVVRRYAPDSTSFADTHKAALADIHPGDQLRARGAKDAAGVSAEEIVAGSFRNIAGTVLGTNASANTVSLTDLATKRPITLHLDANTQLRKLSPEVAARLAHRGNAERNPGAGQEAGSRPRGAGGEAQLLQRAPTITLADLKKGDAVMIVASGPGAAQPTAITVVSGVEPLLEGSPEASAGLFSASWNIGGGGDASAGEGAPQR